MEDVVDFPGGREMESIGNFGYLGGYYKWSILPWC